MAGLEDPLLMERMRSARADLQRQERARERLIELKALTEQDLEARRVLSAMMLALHEQRAKLQCVYEDVSLQTTNISRLVQGGPDGKPPHGFPAVSRPVDEPTGSNMKHLAKKLTTAGTDIDGVVKALDELERELTLMRRRFEQIVDGLRKHVTA